MLIFSASSVSGSDLTRLPPIEIDHPKSEFTFDMLKLSSSEPIILLGQCNSNIKSHVLPIGRVPLRDTLPRPPAEPATDKLHCSGSRFPRRKAVIRYFHTYTHYTQCVILCVACYIAHTEQVANWEIKRVIIYSLHF